MNLGGGGDTSNCKGVESFGVILVNYCKGELLRVKYCGVCVLF